MDPDELFWLYRSFVMFAVNAERLSFLISNKYAKK
jgi:hypothetical protein